MNKKYLLIAACTMTGICNSLHAMNEHPSNLVRPKSLGSQYPGLYTYPRYPYQEEFEAIKEALPLEKDQGYPSTAEAIGLAASILPEEQQNMYPFKNVSREDVQFGRVVHPSGLYYYHIPTGKDIEGIDNQLTHYYQTFQKRQHRMANPITWYDSLRNWWSGDRRWSNLATQEKVAAIRRANLEQYRNDLHNWLNALSEEERKALEELSYIDRERERLRSGDEKRRIFSGS